MDDNSEGAGLDTLYNEIDGYLDTIQTKKECRFEAFKKAFNQEFPKDEGIKEALDRERADTILWALFDTVFNLYIFGLKGPAVVELYSILERFTLREAVDSLSCSKTEDEIKELVAYRSLEQNARTLNKMGEIPDERMKFVENIQRIRNGLAHKNEELVSNRLYSGKDIHILDIEKVVAEELDLSSLIIEGVKYFVDLLE